MTTIHETLPIACPYASAKRYLHDELAPLSRDGKSEVRTLRVAFGGSEISAPVVMEYTANPDPMGFDEPWAIMWSPKDTNLYPQFGGTLCVRAGEDWDRAVLEINGEYTPPLGIAGAAFDVAIGKKIARATAQTLLGEIGKAMEIRHSGEEEAKAAQRREATKG